MGSLIPTRSPPIMLRDRFFSRGLVRGSPFSAIDSRQMQRPKTAMRGLWISISMIRIYPGWNMPREETGSRLAIFILPYLKMRQVAFQAGELGAFDG